MTDASDDCERLLRGMRLTGLELSRILNAECIRQGADVPMIFDAAARIAAAYCLHTAKWSVDQERTAPTHAAAGDTALRCLERFTGSITAYITRAVEHGEDPLGEGR